MTVQTNTNVANFLGNGAATYPIGFKFNSAADLVVQKTVIATGVTTTLTLNSDYSVAGAGVEEGGSITFSQAPTSAESIKVTRVVDLLQLTDLRNQGKFYAEVHEAVFDKLAMIDQQQQTEIDDANAKSDEAVATANAANAKSDQAVAKAAQNLIDMQAQYDAFEQGAALYVIGDYAAGLVISAYNQIFRKDGEFYRAAASLDLPYTLTGNWETESVNFVSVGDDVLRQELANPTDPAKGAGLIGYMGRTLGDKLKEWVSVTDFGAKGDGASDDTASIQAAIDSLTLTGGVVYFPPGTYRVSRNVGVNDRWGIKVTGNNITLRGDMASLRRFNTDIGTNAGTYAVLFVGVPDNDSAPLTENVVIDGLHFIGEDIRHSMVGNLPTDLRYAIEFKNTRNTWVKDCVFSKIDSQAINYKKPASYDYANSAFYNTTKNYQSKVTGCSFIAEPHSVSGRSLIHAIAVGGIDFCHISNNYFEWCDDCVAGETTYNRFSDTESDTFVGSGSSAALGPLMRSGRHVVISDNTCYNSSEHAFYASVMDVSISGNKIYTDAPTVCVGPMIQIRGRGVSCAGNVISNYPTAISIYEPAFDVAITGNVLRSTGHSAVGVIDISAFGLSSFISSRPALYRSGAPDYRPMGNISIVGNTITMPDSAAPSTQGHAGFRIYTNQSDANYPNGQISGVTISGNTLKGHSIGIWAINSLMNNIAITGNTFYAKEFTRAGFSSATTMLTRAIVQAYQFGAGSSFVTMRNMSFSNNHVDGAEYLFATHTGAGGANTYNPPFGIVGNRLNYIKNLKTADIGLSVVSRFAENTGEFFLDRSVFMPNNSLGDGATYNSTIKNTFQWTGSAMRYYIDDAGGFVTL